MNRIWQWITGGVRLRLTSADPERMLRMISEQIPVCDLVWESGMEVCFCVLRGHLPKVQKIANRSDTRLEVVNCTGLPVVIRSCVRYPVICAAVAVLLAATIGLPGRILFIQVEGNQDIPDSLILERAADCGLHFGADRSELRSEQIKNRLLSSLPELSWVGVNTQGCVATIRIQERQMEPESDTPVPGNIVASEDAVVLRVTATAGNTLCAPGDAVRKGQILISGYTDLGLCTHVEAAEGEVFGLTSHTITAVIPEKQWSRDENGAVVKKYSVIFGKKRINFYSNSGILHTGCGKMTKIRYLRLPGGWTLPIALVTQIVTISELSETERFLPEAEEGLRQVSQRTVAQDMAAGQIISAREESLDGGGRCGIRTVYSCEEMIGRRRSGIFTEGDTTYDGENG